MHVWLPYHLYRAAMQTSSYLSKGIESAIEEHLGIELEGDASMRFRVLEFGSRDVHIQIDSDWVKPTRR